jgi:FKBP-type peptidyl-prolyl cis-trans isomerase FklB
MKSVVAGVLGLVLLSGVCLAADKKELKSETERINYSVGYQIGGDFKSQGVELDPGALVQGIQDALKKNEPLLSKEEMNTTLVNLKKRIMSDQQKADKKAAAENSRASAAFLAENAKQKGVTVLPSGVQYKVLKEGSGRKPTLKDEVKVHYRITRVDGKEIANTYAGDKPRTSALAKAMPGLQEVLPLMQEGAKWQIVFPASTASGGREPLDDMGVLIYEMELISVSPAK